MATTRAVQRALVVATLGGLCSAYRQYPLYMQCDPRWGTNPMGVDGPGERSTVCGEGCAMSCVSMALAGLGATVTGKIPTPGSLNAWLMTPPPGYLCIDNDCNNLNLTAPTRLNSTFVLVGENQKQPVADIQAGLTRGDTIYIAHIPTLHHFVLLTNFSSPDSTRFTVNDPFYNATSYDWGNFSDIIVYKIVPSNDDAATKPSVPQLVASRHSGVHALSSSAAPRVPADVVARATSPRGTAPVVPFTYPLYKQCNSSWGSDKMVNSTICQVGCLMSSVSMALAGNGIAINGAGANPQTFNAWLRSHKGYVGDSSLEEAAVPALDPAHVWWPADADHRNVTGLPYAVMKWMIDYSRPVIANVMQGHHFVLVVGYDAADADIIYVNDPGFETASYSISKDVVGWRLFNMQHA